MAHAAYVLYFSWCCLRFSRRLLLVLLSLFSLTFSLLLLFVLYFSHRDIYFYLIYFVRRRFANFHTVVFPFSAHLSAPPCYYCNTTPGSQLTAPTSTPTTAGAVGNWLLLFALYLVLAFSAFALPFVSFICVHTYLFCSIQARAPVLCRLLPFLSFHFDTRFQLICRFDDKNFSFQLWLTWRGERYGGLADAAAEVHKFIG